MTRTIKLRFVIEDDYAVVLVAMRPFMPHGIPTVDCHAELHAQAIAAICRAQSAPAKPPAAAGPPKLADSPFFADVTGA